MGIECVEFVGVQVLDEENLVLLCLIEGKRHWIGVGRAQLGSTVAHRGDRGRLVLEQQFAHGLGFKSLRRAARPQTPDGMSRRPF